MTPARKRPWTVVIAAALAALAALALAQLAPTARGVAGGVPANPEAWPSTVALLEPGVADPAAAQFCAGSVVRGEWVLTAAHCVVDEATGAALRPGDVEVGVGASDLRAIGPVRRIGVAEVVIYPGYRIDRPARDVALLRLARPSGVPAAELSVSAYDPGGVGSAWLAGWGLNETGSTQLLTGSASVIALKDCIRHLRPLGAVWGTICATLPASLEAATCSGDSGGPLADFTRGGLIIGITSYGPAICGPGVPGVYSDVAAYRPWIMRVTAGGPPLPALPEVSSLFARDTGRRLLLRAKWCQSGAVGNRMVAQFTGERVDGARAAGGLAGTFVQSVRGRSPGECLVATLRLRDRYRNGLWLVRVKVIDRSTGLRSYGFPSYFSVS